MYKNSILKPVTDRKRGKTRIRWSNVTILYLVGYRTARCISVVHECQDTKLDIADDRDKEGDLLNSQETYQFP